MVVRAFCLSICMIFLATAPAAAMEIALEQRGDIYTLPVLVNGVLTLNFILDSGASEVVIPSNYVSVLLHAGTITAKDYLPGKSFRLADGSLIRSSRFKIRELNIRGYKIFDVPGVVSPITGPPLLGQSFLNRVESWTLDNRAHKLILNGPTQTGAAAPDSQSQPQSVGGKSGRGGDKTALPGSSPKPKSPDTPDTQNTGEAKSSRPLIPPSVHLEGLDQSGTSASKILIPPSVHP